MKTPVLYPLSARPAVAVYQTQRRGSIPSLVWRFLRPILAALLGTLGGALAAYAVARTCGPVLGWIPSLLPSFLAYLSCLLLAIRFVR